ncbi:MAG: hypothetical protein AAGD32_03785 [Planctomycetota bacterium]
MKLSIALLTLMVLSGCRAWEYREVSVKCVDSASEEPIVQGLLRVSYVSEGLTAFRGPDAVVVPLDETGIARADIAVEPRGFFTVFDLEDNPRYLRSPVGREDSDDAEIEFRFKEKGFAVLGPRTSFPFGMQVEIDGFRRLNSRSLVIDGEVAGPSPDSGELEPSRSVDSLPILKVRIIRDAETGKVLWKTDKPFDRL